MPASYKVGDVVLNATGETWGHGDTAVHPSERAIVTGVTRSTLDPLGSGIPSFERPQLIATRVLRNRLLSWSAWAMEPGGIWVHIATSLTRRGAKRELRVFLQGLQ